MSPSDPAHLAAVVRALVIALDDDVATVTPSHRAPALGGAAVRVQRAGAVVWVHVHRDAPPATGLTYTARDAAGAELPSVPHAVGASRVAEVAWHVRDLLDGLAPHHRQRPPMHAAHLSRLRAAGQVEVRRAA